jgi:Zn-dependent peptidase ImmA (M78 family)
MAAPYEMSIADPRAAALRAQYHALFADGAELPVPIEAIAEDLLGLRVVEEPLEVSGLLYPGRRLVVLNMDESSVRRRFTLAHEIGHWVCQCLEGTDAPVLCRQQDLAAGTDRALEREANIFAADLLMPADAVAALHGAGPQDVAERLAVSGPALGWRLYNLGLVADKPA